jgi:hypothetical protein
MTFFNKLKWVLGILVVFLLIVTTNLIDRNNFVRVKESVETIYEDRLVAKGILFDMLTNLQEKEIAIIKKDTAFFNSKNSKINTGLRNLITKFENTKLTTSESNIFNSLKEDIDVLIDLEKKHEQSDFKNSIKSLNQIEKVKQDLDDLSDIQIDEGSRQLSISKKAIDNVELFTQLEIYFLIILAVIIQIIVIYNPKDKKEENGS